ncbi:MAG: preprotein translocase subunit YajC [Phycisphaeraceae bacterium]|nr:preprotein translocase subunit YajC [Phycisphaeraceae bacterium]QYK49533.1 MAG: preprotein translocase subunit YajC [Phycisphaeraceae bacterium]
MSDVISMSWVGQIGSSQAMAMQDAAAGPGWAPSTAAPGTGEQQPVGPRTGAAQQGGGSFFMTMIVLMLVMMVLMTVFSGRKDRKRREQLISSLKKNDKVQTVGGIIGHVAEVRNDEVVLRVDENSNVRLRFAKAAITGVIQSSGGTDRAVEEKPNAFQREATGAGA